jgi:hypothetical protein
VKNIQHPLGADEMFPLLFPDPFRAVGQHGDMDQSKSSATQQRKNMPLKSELF